MGCAIQATATGTLDNVYAFVYERAVSWSRERTAPSSVASRPRTSRSC